MNKDDFDLLHKFKTEQISNTALELFNGLEDRCFGFVRKNVKSKESIELFAEEEFVRKKDFSEMRCEMPGIPRSTFLMVFSPDGSRVASTHGNHNIYITDLRNGKNIKTLVGHPRTPWCIAFHPNSDQIIASGCLGGQVRIWDLSGGSEVWTAVNQTVIASLAFHPNDRVLAIATYNCVYFWDWSKPEPFVSAATYNVKEKVRYVAFDTLGHKLITGIANSPITRWERVRAPVPVPRRQEWSATPYRRRITQMLANGNQNPYQPNNTDNSTNTTSRESMLNFPDRERRISMCYRTLVREYEQLVHRYLQLYRSPTMIDRGTDPMEPDLWFYNSATQTAEPQPSTSGISQNQTNRSAADRVLDETLPSTSGASGSQYTASREEVTNAEPLPSTSSQSPSKSAYNLLTPSRIFSVIKKPNTLIRSTQTSESRKHKVEDGEQPKEKRFKKSNGTNTKSSKKSKSDEQSNSTQTDQTPIVRKVVPINTLRNSSTDSMMTSSSSSEFRVRSAQEESFDTPGPSGLHRQESTETEEEMMIDTNETPQNSSNRREGNSNQANVDELLTNIKRTAEEEVRNRILPIIRSLPATDRPELIRLFENNREHVRMRFRKMYPNFLRKTNRRHLNLVETTSDSSSSEEDTNPAAPSTSNQSFRNAATTSNQTANQSNLASANSNDCSELERLVVLLTDIDNNGTDRGAQTSRDRENGETIHEPSQNTSINRTEPQPAESSTHFNERDSTFQPPATVANTSTRTTNSTIYTSNSTASRRRFFSHRISAFMPTRVNYIRHRRMPHYVWGRNRMNSRPYGNSTFGVDELFNYSELDNSEDDPPPPPPPDADHPETPATSSSEASISDMYSNIVRELESSLENVVRMRVSTRPGETSNMLSSFSERLESILSQSEAILRNLSNSMDVLVSNTLPGRLNLTQTITSLFVGDPNFFMRDQRTENLSPDVNSGATVNLYDLFSRPSYNAIASDHTYPRNPEDADHTPPIGETETPMVATIHLTIMHIQRQARLLREQVENIERIDRAMLEVEQLQLIRRLIYKLIGHISASSTPAGSSRTSGTGGVSSVRQMMAGTRISDSSPQGSGTEEGQSSRSGWSNTRDIPMSSREINELDEQSRPEVETGESSSSGNTNTQSRPRNAGRKTYPPSRMYRLARQCRRPSALRFFLRPYTNRSERSSRYSTQSRNASRSTTSNSATPEASPANDRYQTFSSYSVINSNTLKLMTIRLERLLTEEMASSMTGQPRQNGRSTATIDLGEHILALRLHGCVLRMNRILGNGVVSSAIGNLRADPTAAVTQDGVSRYNARHSLSLIIDSMSRHVEELGNASISQVPQMRVVLAMSLLLTELMLLVVVDSIPPPSGVNLTNERVSLASRIDRLCGLMLQIRQFSYSYQLTRSLRLMKMTMRHAQNALGQTYHARRNTLLLRHNTDRRMLLGSINRCLRTIRRQRQSDSTTPASQDTPSTSQENLNDNASASTPLGNNDWYSSVSDLIAHISTSNEEDSTLGDPQPSTSRSFLPSGPQNDVSSNNDNSDEDDDDTDGYSNVGGTNLYRTSNINLSPGGGEASGGSSVSPPPIDSSYSRPWDVPRVHVNDVPVSESRMFAQRLINQRARLAERVSELRSNPQMVGSLFRPRFLHPLYASVNPFDADLDDPQREQIYDSDMITTVTPNHRIQAWDVSDWSIPNIGSATRNLVVGECKIHNDASVDIAKDGTILVTLLPSGGYLNVTNRLGVYSLRWETLGQCLYTTSFEQNAVSVSLSPLSRHLVVGLASRIVPSDRWIMARIFKIHQKDEPGDRLPVIRELEQNRDSRINCIRWLPASGQGLIYATNTGQLVVLT